jgi:hypothetical protein
MFAYNKKAANMAKKLDKKSIKKRHITDNAGPANAGKTETLEKNEAHFMWRGIFSLMMIFIIIMLIRTTLVMPAYRSFILFPILGIIAVILLELLLPKDMKLYWRISIVVIATAALFILISLLAYYIARRII